MSIETVQICNRFLWKGDQGSAKAAKSKLEYRLSPKTRRWTRVERHGLTDQSLPHQKPMAYSGKSSIIMGDLD
ncbi:hypothetical protein GQ457_02G017450 [Hibiscus cannabinus]|uniref:Uncharacterized protein n=1 Tax=Hibiscus sabdariffa TaxID=183260 RepID=A0ABR2TJI9_9ROSI